MTEQTIPTPEFKFGISRYEFSWKSLGITVLCDRMTDEGVGELSFIHRNGENKPRLLHMTNVNLLSTTSCNTAVKRLQQNLDLDWQTILTHVAHLSMTELRRGEPVYRVGKTKPQRLKIEYQLKPIIEKNQPTTIYAPGGSVKSYLAIYIAILIQCNIHGLDGQWAPVAGNVLYLDWEGSLDSFERRVWAVKQGLKTQGVLVGDEEILYRACSRPFVHDIENIRQIVSDNKIETLIVDSAMAAAPGSTYNNDQTHIASQYYNALRSCKCTSLTIDHISKEQWKGLIPDLGPMGPVVKYNRSRSQYEVKKTQKSGDNYVELALIHKKHNEGMLLNPIGIRVEFNNNDDYLKDVTFTPCEIEGDLAQKSLTLVQLIQQALEEESPLSVKDISSVIDRPQGSIKTELNRNKGTFVKVADKWGLLEKRYDTIGD